MKKYDDKYLVSSGDVDDDYGLFIMESDESKDAKQMYLTYFFDSDRFIYITPDLLKLFTKPSSLKLCKDEFGNKYEKKELDLRIKEAIKAFREELPGFRNLEKETDNVEKKKKWQI